MPRDHSFIFDVDNAGPHVPPPVLFHAIRVPCACGRALTERVYTFFPSAVFVHGMCEVCGPQQAIFAPYMPAIGEPLPAAIARTLGHLATDLARLHGENVQTVLAEFLNYLAETEASTLPGAA